MARYFFCVHDGLDIPDTEGTELPDIDQARVEAVSLAGQLLSDGALAFWNGHDWSLDVKDDSGEILFTLNFTATVMAKAAT